MDSLIDGGFKERTPKADNNDLIGFLVHQNCSKHFLIGVSNVS